MRNEGDTSGSHSQSTAGGTPARSYGGVGRGCGMGRGRGVTLGVAVGVGVALGVGVGVTVGVGLGPPVVDCMLRDAAPPAVPAKA